MRFGIQFLCLSGFFMNRGRSMFLRRSVGSGFCFDGIELGTPYDEHVTEDKSCGHQSDSIFGLFSPLPSSPNAKMMVFTFCVIKRRGRRFGKLCGSIRSGFRKKIGSVSVPGVGTKIIYPNRTLFCSKFQPTACSFAK